MTHCYYEHFPYSQLCFFIFSHLLTIKYLHYLHLSFFKTFKLPFLVIVTKARHHTNSNFTVVHICLVSFFLYNFECDNKKYFLKASFLFFSPWNQNNKGPIRKPSDVATGHELFSFPTLYFLIICIMTSNWISCKLVFSSFYNI